MTGWRDEARERAWRTYIEASVRLQTRLDECLQHDTGLSLIDYHVLLLLSEANDQRLRMGELAGRLVFSPSRLTYQVSSMEKRGLVLRERTPEDRRGTRAVLTAAGLHALRAAWPPHSRAIHDLFLDDLDDDEVECLGRIFSRVGARLGG
ncbi:MarR family winged helix-turn-helix transcriptional regulator [Pseudonocardia acaciae]|uniref:MarR family winged helix-turn-helix transcriptional regulator n=1 Tax=Pseudonocardia acaciae TaxID=551276 RepID=UPI00048F02C7|nr:MarR family transcriptional regulator [Pseudonocardia acaciae]